MTATKPCAEQVSIVTGASRGIGLAIAEQLGRLGSRVVLLARHQEPLQKAAARVAAHGVETLPLTCDVQDATAVRAAFAPNDVRSGALDATLTVA